MSYRVTKTIEFSYGHRLPSHSGKCKNLHGHNGKIEIVMEKKSLNSKGMVADFSIVGRRIKNWIDKNWDHRMILSRRDPWQKILKKLDPMAVIIGADPTAENLAQIVFSRAKALGFPVIEVRFWETKTSWASYRPAGRERVEPPPGRASPTGGGRGFKILNYACRSKRGNDLENLGRVGNLRVFIQSQGSPDAEVLF